MSIAIIPLKGFREAKRRLDLSDDARADLARAVARHVLEACIGSGLDPLVVTGSTVVRDWAVEAGAETIPDPGTGGLNAAAGHAASTANARGRSWIIVHGDLPLLTPSDLAPVVDAIREGRAVIAPSRDGGTNVLGDSRPLRFAYGPGSFHRHLGAAAGRPLAVIVRPGTAIEIDTRDDLQVAASLSQGAWLSRFLS